MKKLVLGAAFAAIALAGTANAQIQEGNWLVGGHVANIQFTKPFTIDLSPKAAYFVKDNWAVGAGVDVKYADGSETTWSIAPFTRYYFNTNEIDGLLNHGRFFAEGSAGFGGKNEEVGEKNSTNGVKLGIGAGYAYFITPNVSVEGLLKFDGYVGGGNKSGNGDLNLGVGFSIYLPTRTAQASLRDQQ
ncbi:MAG: hypothetical protein EAS48_09050 [Chryseobacterium sp.]|nr:MAG: hypothetical protein EAS48_09050 [Chryseobacterium sp.]